jgi:hypothetical protein
MIPHVKLRSSMSGLTPIVFTAAIVGVILGILLAHALFLGWWTLVPWGIAGLALGYKAKGQFVLTGIVYGFVLVFVFLIDQYSGEQSLVSRLPFFALFGVFGAICGLILTTAGSFILRLRDFR